MDELIVLWVNWGKLRMNDEGGGDGRRHTDYSKYSEYPIQWIKWIYSNIHPTRMWHPGPGNSSSQEFLYRNKSRKKLVPKKSRNRSRKNLVPKKVSEPVSKKYICTSDCNDHLVSLIMLPIIACQGYIRKVSQKMQWPCCFYSSMQW